MYRKQQQYVCFIRALSPSIHDLVLEMYSYLMLIIDFLLFKAPETGDYRFYIASDDSSELRISTDDTKANAKKIAGVRGHTNPKQFNKYVIPSIISLLDCLSLNLSICPYVSQLFCTWLVNQFSFVKTPRKFIVSTTLN